MIVTLKVPDDVYELYVEKNRTNPRLAMEQTLERFKEAPARVVVLEDGVRKELEKLLGFTLEDQRRFLEFIRERMSVTVEGVKVALKPFQLRNVVAQAKSLHREIDEHVRARVEKAISMELGPS